MSRASTSPGSDELRNVQHADFPRRLLSVNVRDGGVGRAEIDSDDVATGQLVDKRIKVLVVKFRTLIAHREASAASSRTLNSSFQRWSVFTALHQSSNIPNSVMLASNLTAA